MYKSKDYSLPSLQTKQGIWGEGGGGEDVYLRNKNHEILDSTPWDRINKNKNKQIG